MCKEKPGFLIVGAAKSGTTSLYHYLKHHPDIFMSPIKEPDYFGGYDWNLPLRNIHGPNPDLQIYQEWIEYLNLFEEAKNLLAGEASPSSLFYYKTSIPEIKNRLNDPKIIILLRDPVERAYSHFSFLKRDGKEDLTFLDALQAQQHRIKDNYHYGYFYEALGYYYEPVKAFKDNFSCGIWTFEELKSDTQRVFREICSFLEISTEFNLNLDTKYNVSGTPKSNSLNTFLRKKNKFRDLMRPVLDMIISQEKKESLMEFLHSKNIKPKDPMPEQAKRYLQNCYKNDIKQLKKEVSLDLSSWKSFK
jgi:hypothetical protein